MNNNDSPVSFTPDGELYREGWAQWYYGVHPSDVASLNIEDRFGVVSSPTPFSSTSEWDYVVFMVVVSAVRGEHSRMYRIVYRRPLEDWEIDHFVYAYTNGIPDALAACGVRVE